MPILDNLFQMNGINPSLGLLGNAQAYLPMRLPYGPRYNPQTGNMDSPQLKGFGFYGPLIAGGDNNNIASEYSMGANINGTNQEFPSIVPGLNPSQLQSVLNAAGNGSPVPNDVAKIASDFAASRLAKGQSPFWDSQIDPFPQWSPAQYWPDVK